MATVEFQNIHKTYGTTEIIRGINLTIHDRELTVFVGPSGCGKSTLLRMIAGLEEITSGNLLIDGQRINDVPPARRGLAMVFQSYALYPHMTVAENMSFSLKLAGVSKAERAAKVHEAACILNLDTYLDRKPKDLSGGQRQRVAIGRAIVRNPRVFLFDEPLSNLDAALRVRMRLELTTLHRKLNATMIYVTHDQVEAMTMADRIVILNGGIIEQVGTPMELYHSPRNRFVAGFIGSPRMNFLEAIVKTQTTLALADDVLFTVPNLKAPKKSQIGEKLTLGIRPEHLTVSSTAGLRVIVQTVEHLGSESYLHVQNPSGAPLTLRVNGETKIQPDQAIALSFDPEHLHLFNSEGKAIPSTSAS